MNLKPQIGRQDEKGRENFGVRQFPLFNQIRPEWSTCESFSDVQGMSGLNIEVSEHLPIEDDYMRCRDGNLTFTGSSTGNFDVLWGYLMAN